MRKTRILHLKITPRSVIITCNSQRLKTLPYKQLQAIGSHECANLQRKSPVELPQEPSELHPCSIPKQLSAETDSDQALSSVAKKTSTQRSIAKRKISTRSVQRAACLFIKGTLYHLWITATHIAQGWVILLGMLCAPFHHAGDKCPADSETDTS